MIISKLFKISQFSLHDVFTHCLEPVAYITMHVVPKKHLVQYCLKTMKHLPQKIRDVFTVRYE